METAENAAAGTILGKVGRLAVLAAAGGAAAGAYGAYANYANRRFENLDPQSADAPGSFLDIDGDQIHYVDAGRGPAVVLIHGWNGSTFSYRYVISELARQYRVVAIDLRGYGYSSRSLTAEYSGAAQARLVAQVMDRLAIETATLVGHSMGGGIAMRLALAEPQRVQRLVLVDSVTENEVRSAIRHGRLLRRALPLLAPLTMHRQRFRDRALRSAVHDPAYVTEETREGYYRPFHMRGHLASMAKQYADWGKDDLWSPERITQETLVLWGEHDRWISVESGRVLAEQIPNARFVLVRSAGHLPLGEQPEFCNRELLRFLDAGAEPEPASPEAEQAHSQL